MPSSKPKTTSQTQPTPGSRKRRCVRRPGVLPGTIGSSSRMKILFFITLDGSIRTIYANFRKEREECPKKRSLCNLRKNRIRFSLVRNPFPWATSHLNWTIQATRTTRASLSTGARTKSICLCLRMCVPPSSLAVINRSTQTSTTSYEASMKELRFIRIVFWIKFQLSKETTWSI